MNTATAEEIVKTLYEFGPQKQEVVGKTYAECGYCDHTLPEHYDFCIWLAIKKYAEKGKE